MVTYSLFTNISPSTIEPLVDTENLLLAAKNRNEEGDYAIQQLLFNYMGLILKTRNKYISHTSSTFDADDLLSTAILGFFRAIQLYDPTQKVKFITYAFASMQFQIWRAIETQSSALRLPTVVQHNKYRIQKASNSLQQGLGRKPTASEIAEYCKIDIIKVETILSLPYVSGSLDDPIDQDLDSSLGDFLPDLSSRFSNFDSEIDRKELLLFLEGVLSPRQYDILCMHYGLLPEYEEGLNVLDISKHLKISRENVRQIHAETIKILLYPEHKQYLYLLLI